MRRVLPGLGLRARIALAVVLVTTVATVGMAFTAYQLQATQTTERFIKAAEVGFDSDVREVQARTIVANGNSGTAVEYLRDKRGVDWSLFYFGRGVHRAIAVGEDYSANSAMASNSVIAPPTELIDRALLGPKATELVESDHGPALLIAEPLGADLVLVERYSMRTLRDELTSLQRILAVVAAIAAVLGVVAALIAASRIQRPVREVAAAARQLGGGALDVRLPVQGRDELADLTSSFNAMAQRLGESIDQLKAKDRQQRRFVADVAHDLRTPIGAMVAAADSLEHQDPVSRSRSARLLGDQARRVARLVEDLLEISRFDAGVAELRPEPVDLRALVMDAIELNAEGGDIRVHSHGDHVVVADPRRLHTVVGNLLVNALRHGAEPVTVTIDGRDPATVSIEIADSGPGVDPDLAPIVFDRFVLGDQSRSGSGGSGLGLSIARENTVAHGGRIELANRGGAVFTVVLPRTVRVAPEDAEQD